MMTDLVWEFAHAGAAELLHHPAEAGLVVVGVAAHLVSQFEPI